MGLETALTPRTSHTLTTYLTQQTNIIHGLWGYDSSWKIFIIVYQPNCYNNESGMHRFFMNRLTTRRMNFLLEFIDTEKIKNLNVRYLVT